MPLPQVGLVVYPDFNPFHFAVPQMVFSLQLPQGPLFCLHTLAVTSELQLGRGGVSVKPTGDVRQMDNMDILVVSGWHDIHQAPEPALVDALQRAHARGACIVGLCYGVYALAYAGLLDGKPASTHWLAEQDFAVRFPRVKLDLNALYVESDNLITSAGTAAGLDCCLHIVRRYHGASMANNVARVMVVAPHREGGQAQFIEQPVAATTQDAKINQLLDHLRQHLAKQHRIEKLAETAAMSRRTFTRHFKRATGLTLVDWLINERVRLSRELLETSSLSIEQIAQRCGFHTAVSFRQHFRNKHHVSPSQWRKVFIGTNTNQSANADR
ncbi:GlxA family transcriptional regulator [Bowmanella denitrificans]|uniref:GlxA family transcriptional regulator n=1 Tax=Bowmanella denitrificans TaxID=366582 RepID=UPI000C9B7517|nr:helix-turn-helix domain-containing protein [Bowmanella denitrificans]